MAFPAALPQTAWRRRSLVAASACGAWASLAALTPAHAQSENFFDRSNNVGVLQRPRPDYDALGIDVRGFTVFPSLTLTPEYDDNIFATDHDTTSDFIASIQPTVSAQSNWSRNAVNFSVSDTSNLYASHSEENTNDYRFYGGGRYDIGTYSNVTADASYGNNTIPRTAENNITTAQAPVQYSLVSANVGALQGFSRIRTSETFSFAQTNYDNEASLDLNPLNNNQYSLSGRVDYAFTPELAFYASGNYNRREYPTPTGTFTIANGSATLNVPLDRTSQGYQATVGADFDVTRLLRGDVQVGYLQQNYSSSLFRPVSGPAVQASVQYYLSGLTTLTAKVDRQVVDAVDPRAVSYFDTQVSLQVDHELLRNLILSARGSYENADFRGIDRDDNRPSVTASATYLFNRYMSLTGSYSFLNESSSGAQRIGDYTVNVLSLALVLRL